MVHMQPYRSGEFVTVSWSNVPNPTPGDAIVMFLNDTIDFSNTLPIRFKWVTTIGPSWSTGAGSVTFQVLNYRAPVRFHYFSNASVSIPQVQEQGFATLPLTFTSDRVLVSSPAVGFNEYNAPHHLHLALTGKPGEMLVQWTSAVEEGPIVRWGLSPTTLTNTVQANTTMMTPGDLCPDSPAANEGWIDPGFQHTALLKGLVPETTYFYSVGDQVGTGVVCSSVCTVSHTLCTGARPVFQRDVLHDGPASRPQHHAAHAGLGGCRAGRRGRRRHLGPRLGKPSLCSARHASGAQSVCSR